MSSIQKNGEEGHKNKENNTENNSEDCLWEIIMFEEIDWEKRKRVKEEEIERKQDQIHLWEFYNTFLPPAEYDSDDVYDKEEVE
jgi:hypothetical protein